MTRTARNSRNRALWWLVAAVAAVMAIPGDAAAASVADVRTKIEKDYDVTVLKIERGQEHGHQMFFVTVMYNGGNFNTAFQVNTLVVDAESGKLVSQFKHLPSGHESAGAFDNEPNRQSPTALRGNVWR